MALGSNHRASGEGTGAKRAHAFFAVELVQRVDNVAYPRSVVATKGSGGAGPKRGEREGDEGGNQGGGGGGREGKEEGGGGE